MKHFSISVGAGLASVRWFGKSAVAILFICLLLCGAGALSIATWSTEGQGAPPADERAPAQAPAAPAVACAVRAIAAGLEQDYTSVQAAVDAADPDTTVRVAGDCTGVSTVNYEVQLVHLTKNVTIEGGYDSSDWAAAPDPITIPRLSIPASVPVSRGGSSPSSTPRL